jgi:hypothetical protein
MTDPKTYFKACRPDGTDFRTGTIDYLTGDTIAHPDYRKGVDAAHYLSVSTSAADCTGFAWPARLLEVEAVGEVTTPHPSNLPNKRAVKAVRVVRVLPAWQLFGPNGEQVVALIEQAKTLTPEQSRALVAAWAAAWDAARAAAWDTAWAAARDAARAAARDAARAAVWDAAWAAARALVVRDLITPEQFDLLAGPWVSVMGDPKEMVK